VIRTCRVMGIRTVAVYADPDREAPFVRAADEAVSIGPPVSTSSFLAIEAMLDVSRRTRGCPSTPSMVRSGGRASARTSLPR